MQSLNDFVADWQAAQKRASRTTDEAAYLQIWQTHAGPVEDPIIQAAVGGVCADRLAWVFVSGYQAAIRSSFAVSGRGWFAYAASEDRQGILEPVRWSARPGSGCLNGCKTWVAAVDHVSELIVRVNADPGPRYFRIPRTRSGLEFTTRARAGFLGDLSQGQVRFVDLALEDADELSASGASQFGRQEAVAIYAAFCGFVLAHPELTAEHGQCLALIDEAQQLMGMPDGDDEDLNRLRAFDLQIQQLYGRAGPVLDGTIPDWSQDQRLITMYSKGISLR